MRADRPRPAGRMRNLATDVTSNRSGVSSGIAGPAEAVRAFSHVEGVTLHPSQMNKEKTKTDKTRQISSSAAARAAAAPACMVVIYGGDLGRRVELPQGEITIGRDDENAIGADLHTVSRRHARLFLRDEGYYIEDL